VTFVERIKDGEERWHAIGWIEDIAIFVVVIPIGMRIQPRRSESSPPVVQPGKKGCFMPKLTAEKRKALQKLARRPDSEIDLSDIPEIQRIPTDAVIGRFYRPRKTSVTIRLDSDVVAWLKATGEGYQTRINAYLRQLMRQSQQR
jgi:uncharacterized protein (DUF4415 family)